MKCICNPDICTGCGACAAFCPDKKLRIVKGDNGFYRIDPDSLNNADRCSGCDFVCPQLEENRESAQAAYAVQLKDEALLLESTSGGMFTALANFVFARGGVVAGAVYDKNLRVHHAIASNLAETIPMRGSKYIMSDLGNIYFEVQKRLKQGQWVLFVSVPCQVAGLKAFLHQKFETLITADLVCSGVPSQILFDGFLEEYARKIRAAKICDIRFRDKHDYGLSHTFVCEYLDKSHQLCKIVEKDRNRISYYNAFGAENCFMHNCYHCKYAGLKKASEFTIGGLWNEDIGVPFSYEKGVSLAIVNNDAGVAIMKQLMTDEINIQEIRIEDAVVRNRALIRPTSSKDESNSVYSDLKKEGYAFVERKYYKPDSFFKRTLKRILPEQLQRNIVAFLKKLK